VAGAELTDGNRAKDVLEGGCEKSRAGDKEVSRTAEEVKQLNAMRRQSRTRRNGCGFSGICKCNVCVFP
jgi:hypothetical protein